MPKIAFIHVPKTGGSKFVGAIIDFWPRELVSPYTGIAGFMRDPNPSKYHFTAGHVFYEKMKELLSPDRYYLTILREPIQRACSHWLHIRRFNHTKAMSIEEWLYRSYDSPLAHNLMAKYYGWWPKALVGIPGHSADVERMPLDVSEEELYDRALENLKSFWHVGVQDRWVETVQKVYTEFGKPLPEHIKQKNAYDYRMLLSDQLLKDFTKFNQVDIALYNYFRNQ
jgi:hypothetical protein